MKLLGAYGLFSSYDMEFHTHSGIEINLAIGKNVTYCIGGETIRLEQGECVIINAAVPHKLYIPENSGGVYGIEVDAEEPESRPLDDGISYLVINTSRLLYYVIIDIVNKFIIDKNDEGLPLCISYLIEHLDVSNNSSLLFSVKRYINEHYSTLGTIGQIADNFHISSVHLQRIYRDRTGETIWTYLSKKRATTAAYLLETTNHPVETIVSLVGLKSRQALYSLFKKYYGMSPQKYRSLHRKNE